VAKIGVNVIVNMVASYLPLAITERFMTWLNPEMKRRQRVADAAAEFTGTQWSADTARAKSALLKQAKADRERTRQTIALPVIQGGVAPRQMEETGRPSG
jgi:hypothetical protein